MFVLAVFLLAAQPKMLRPHGFWELIERMYAWMRGYSWLTKTPNVDPGVVTMRLAIAAISLALASASVHSAELDLGGTAIIAPTPSGFAHLTPDIQPLYDVSMDMLAPTNVRLATFVDEAVMPIALTGEMPEFERYINVETTLELRSMTVTSEQFAELKRIVSRDLDATMAKVMSKMPEGMADMSDRLSETLDLDVALSMSNMVPLPVHQESDRTMANSTIVKYEMATEGGGEDVIVVGTTTFVFLKGKVFFVYVYGGTDDLEWTRAQSAEWIDTIFAANANSSAGQKFEGRLRGNQIDWDRVLGKGAVGAVLGGLIAGGLGIFGWIGRRFKKKADQPPA